MAGFEILSFFCIFGTSRFMHGHSRQHVPAILCRITISFICISHSEEKEDSSFLKWTIDVKNCSLNSLLMINSLINKSLINYTSPDLVFQGNTVNEKNSQFRNSFENYYWQGRRSYGISEDIVWLAKANQTHCIPAGYAWSGAQRLWFQERNV